MKDLEKFLTDVPKPAVEVPAFRDQLRRELQSVAPARTSGSWRFAAYLSASVAAACALTLALFVARPAIPADIHAALTGADGATLDARDLEGLLTRAANDSEADRAFVDNWTAAQDRPLAVRSMEDERLVRVRQFELSDGKKMLVFTELDNDRARPAVMRAASTAPVF